MMYYYKALKMLTFLDSASEARELASFGSARMQDISVDSLEDSGRTPSSWNLSRASSGVSVLFKGHEYETALKKYTYVVLTVGVFVLVAYARDKYSAREHIYYRSVCKGTHHVRSGCYGSSCIVSLAAWFPVNADKDSLQRSFQPGSPDIPDYHWQKVRLLNLISG